MFWPDLASCHYSRDTQNWLRQHRIPFVPKNAKPPNLPQARPIEDFWALLSRKVYDRGWEAQNEQQLRRRIFEKLREIDLNSVQGLMRDIRRNLRLVEEYGPLHIIALRKHVTVVHKQKLVSKHQVKNNKSKRHKCIACDTHFNLKKDLIGHLVKIYDDFKRNTIGALILDFYEWLKDEEKKNTVEYIRTTRKVVGKQYRILPPKHVNRKRLQKSQGSQKIGMICTSHIIIKINNSTSTVKMTYFKTHYGHNIQLQHVRIPESSRNIIASKLALGVSTTNIITPIRNSFSFHGLERTDLVTRKDIYNIRKSFRIDVRDGVRHSDDATSVLLWVKECQASANNPVLFYKPQGTEDRQYNLKSADFCLIIMNDLQCNAIKIFAKKFVFIDGTHGTNPYNFELTTLMVGDDYGEGVAVAFMISNRTDTAIYELFFNQKSMHRILKYEYLEGRKVKRLDKGKRTDRIVTINNSHKLATKSTFIVENVQESCDEFKKWFVTNETTKKYIQLQKRHLVCAVD
ncbi:hypothetical protein NQ315_004015 [Exocentrus adspersus]|uniref:C2H2-type domain-containing protein n=1 Tax=Exocentrus adspersus TaxID=1586481 RepID=A0AAV8V713_9CUCU|nr:hypothetical protein NQ315_004015 [Exocentrus adspersus]